MATFFFDIVDKNNVDNFQSNPSISFEIYLTF